jgi:hypothetical protein
VAPTQRQPLAIWNTARDVWETPETNGLFCEHLDVFSETFPTSGTTVNGVAYALPTWEPAMDDSASSSLPDDATLEYLGTPTSRMWKGAGPQGGATQIRNKARGLIEAQVMDIEPRLLPTVTVSDTNGPGIHGDGGLDLRTAMSLLPTPAAMDGSGGRISKEKGGFRESGAKRSITLSTAVHHDLLPTPRATDGAKGGPNQKGSKGDLMLPSAVPRIGASTSQPSDAGNASLDGQLPGQLSLLDAMADND